VGNRTASLGVSSYTTNASNELTANSNASHTYDSNGNTLTKVVSSNTTTYAWDYENRMTSVTLPGSGGTVTFKYDPLGRRIEKVSPSTTSIFAYDGNNLIETVNATGGVVARYTQGQNIDEPLAESRSGTVSYYEQDGIGSVTSLTNSSGTVAQTYSYDSFGNQTASSGSLTNFFRYAGREFDTETGLYYYRARYYDPTTGRFLSEDRPNVTSDIHGFYQYARNNPALWIDPTGLDPAPPGPPPVPVPGGGPGNGWQWNPNPGNPRGGTWGPQTPIPGQSQPSGSWDPDGHWDIDNGKGGRQRYDPDGNPITPQQAHPSSQCAPKTIAPNMAPLINTTVGVIIIWILIVAGSPAGI
jgi:RHS repeat-associated protein